MPACSAKSARPRDYGAAGAGAVARLRLRDFYDVGDQHCLRFAEKGGKSREIPVVVFERID